MNVNEGTAATGRRLTRSSSALRRRALSRVGTTTSRREIRALATLGAFHVDTTLVEAHAPTRSNAHAKRTRSPRNRLMLAPHGETLPPNDHLPSAARESGAASGVLPRVSPWGTAVNPQGLVACAKD